MHGLGFREAEGLPRGHTAARRGKRRFGARSRAPGASSDPPPSCSRRSPGAGPPAARGHGGGLGGPAGTRARPLRPQGTPADVLYKGTITRIIGEDSPGRLDRGREDGLPKGHVIYEGKKGHVLSYEGEPARGRARGAGLPSPPRGHGGEGTRGAWCSGSRPRAGLGPRVWSPLDGALRPCGQEVPLLILRPGPCPPPAPPAWLLLLAADPGVSGAGQGGEGPGVPKSRLGAQGQPDGTPWGAHVPLPSAPSGWFSCDSEETGVRDMQGSWGPPPGPSREKEAQDQGRREAGLECHREAPSER